MKKYILIGCIPFIICMKSFAQSIGPSALNVSGGSYTSGGNTYEWSVGEMVLVQTFNAGNITVTQGVLQLRDVLFPTSIRSPQLEPTHVWLYPNPASSVVHLQYAFSESGRLKYSVADVLGRKIIEKESQVENSGKEDIDVNGFANGQYLLYIVFTPSNGIPESVSFKIEKIH